MIVLIYLISYFSSIFGRKETPQYKGKKKNKMMHFESKSRIKSRFPFTIHHLSLTQNLFFKT